MPTAPAGSASVRMLGATGARVIVIVNVAVASGDVPLLALTVNVAVAAAVGVPEITPVAPSSVKPAGSEPPDKLQLKGAVPVAASVWL